MRETSMEITQPFCTSVFSFEINAIPALGEGEVSLLGVCETLPQKGAGVSI